MLNKNYKKTLLFTLITLMIIGVICFLVLNKLDNKQNEEAITYSDYDILTIDDQEYREDLDKEVLLLVGLDSYGNEITIEEDAYTNYSLADFLVLIVLDNEDKTVTPIQINRDTMTYYQVLGVLGDVVGDTYGQIALSHTYGNGGLDSVYNVKDAVSRLFKGIHIDYCLSITMDAIGIINDDFGGVEVYIEDNFENVDPTLIQGETILLNGSQAENFVRSRRSMDEPTNIARMERQRVYLNKLFEVFVEKSDDDVLIYKIINDVSDYFISSANTSDLKALIDKAATYELVDTIVVEGESKEGEEYMEYYVDNKKLNELVIKEFTIQ